MDALRPRGSRAGEEERTTEKRRVGVRRITIDEKLADDLFRVVWCWLKPGTSTFRGRVDEWQDEQEVWVTPRTYARALYTTKAQAPPWDTLQEGQVYLSGEFTVVGDPAQPESFAVSPGQRRFLRIDQLDVIDAGVRALYSDVVRGR